jgi:ribonucleotide monophosphatase NagD (HAD superfamily)
MVGDQRSTDIAAGQAAGAFTILVMTGVEAARRPGRGEPHPDLTVPTLVDLRRWLTGRLEKL